MSPSNPLPTVSEPEPPASQPQPEGPRVIAPSQAFMNEMAAQQTTAAAAPKPQPTVTSPQPPATPASLLPTPVSAPAAAQLDSPDIPPSSKERTTGAALFDASKIYSIPTQTGGVSSTTTQPITDNIKLVQSDEKFKIYSIAVMVFGAFIAIPAILRLVGAASILSVASPSTSGQISGSFSFGVILNVLMAILGIGIFLRREVARFIYLLVALIALVFFLYGVISGINDLNKQQSIYNSRIVQDQQRLSQFKQDSKAYSSQGWYQQTVQQYEKNISQDKADAASFQKVYGYKRPDFISSLVISLALILAPIFFLTRKSVKQVFSGNT